MRRTTGCSPVLRILWTQYWSGEGADLVISAVGGLCHLTTDEELGQFLENVKKVLKPGAGAVVSILRDFMPSTAVDYSAKPSSDAPAHNASPPASQTIKAPFGSPR